MTFPTIPTVAAGRVLFTNQADTSATRTFPSLSSLTKNAGDLLIAIVTTYQSSTNPQFSGWGGGFTECSDQGTATTMGIGVAYKWSTGSETGTFTVTQAATITGHASMCLMSIPLAHASTVPEVGTIANGTTTAADPGAFNPVGWGTEDTLWIAVDANGMTSGTGSWTKSGAGTLTNYSGQANSNTTDNSTVGQTEIAVAFRQVNAASEDRGAVSTHDLSNARNSALIIAIRPDLTQALTQSSSFSNSNTLDYQHSISTSIALTQSARFDNSNTLNYTHVISQGGTDQNLTQSARFDNAATFYAHTLTPGAVALNQSARFDNAATFYAHTLTPGAVTLNQSSRFNNSNSLAYQHAIATAITLPQGTRFDNTNGLTYQHSIAATITLPQASRFDNSNDLTYQHAVSQPAGGQNLTQDSRFDNTNSLTYSHSLVSTIVLPQYSQFDNVNNFYQHSLLQGGSQNLTQSSMFNNAGGSGATLGYWNGSAWTDKNLRHWNGSAWV